MVGAPGLKLFRYMLIANTTFITLLGISYFSSVISEEREEGTLGLISMTGISSLSILLGKSTTRLFQALLFLIVQYPLTLLAITLGGLIPAQIIGAYLALAAYAIFVANAGLLCSVVCRRSLDAASLTLLCIVLYAAVPFFAMLTSNAIDSRILDDRPWWVWITPYLQPVLGWVAASNIAGELYGITSSTYQLHLSPQMISNVAAGVILFLASLWLFGVVEHEEVPEDPVVHTGASSTSPWNSLRAGRCWKMAIVWKDFHFIAGGWYGIAIRTALYVGLFLIGVVTHLQMIFERQTSLILTDLLMTYRLFVAPIFLMDCAICLSRPCQDEIRQQTLPTLLLLPYSVWHIVYAKVFGCLIGLTPGLIAISVANLIPVDGEHVVTRFASNGFVWVLLSSVLLLHFCVVLSAFLRIGIIVTACALTIGTILLSYVCTDRLNIANTNASAFYSIHDSFLLAAIIVCHPILFRRLSRLSSR